MSKVPSLNYQQVIKVLRRDGWIVIRQKGSHIRLQKRLSNEMLKIIVPAQASNQTLYVVTHLKTSPPVSIRV